MSKRILRPYQKKIIRYAVRTNYPAFFVDMRLGKTLVTVRWIKHLKVNSVLVVAPYSAFDSWRKEILLEEYTKPVELTGIEMERNNLLLVSWPMCRWFMINKEGFLYLQDLKKYPWDCIVIDESTFIKSPKSKVSKFFVNNFKDVKYKAVLTGLPDPESELDYFQQLQFLNPDILGYKNYYEFEFKNFAMNEYGSFITKKGKKFLTERLSKHCFFLSRKEAGYFKEPIREKRIIKMPDKIRKIYDTIVKDFILETDEYFKMTKFAGTKFSWMREICCGVAYKNETEKELIWDGKIKLLEELLLGELKNVPLIIWCNYIKDIEEIRKYFNDKVNMSHICGKVSQKSRDFHIGAFKKGLIQWLIIQPVCMQYGADLSLASTCIYYSTPYREVREQSENRIEDVEKKETTLIIDLVVEDTIEEGILKSMKRKENRSKMMRGIIMKLRKEYIDA